MALGKAGNSHCFNILPSCSNCNHKKRDKNPYTVFPRRVTDGIDRYFRMLAFWVKGDFKCKDKEKAHQLKAIRGSLGDRNKPLSAFYAEMRADLKKKSKKP